MARLRKLADWLEQESPAAANSLREGLEECFTINRLGIPPSLHRCLATTNLIESPQSGVRMRTRRVCRWRDAAMVQRWAAASFLATEKNFRRIMGWKDLWQLEAILGRKEVIKLQSSRRPRKMNPSAAPLTSNYQRDTVLIVERPSISRRTKTVRKIGLTSSKDLIRMSRNSDAQ